MVYQPSIYTDGEAATNTHAHEHQSLQAYLRGLGDRDLDRCLDCRGLLERERVRFQRLGDRDLKTSEESTSTVTVYANLGVGVHVL